MSFPLSEQEQDLLYGQNLGTVNRPRRVLLTENSMSLSRCFSSPKPEASNSFETFQFRPRSISAPATSDSPIGLEQDSVVEQSNLTRPAPLYYIPPQKPLPTVPDAHPQAYGYSGISTKSNATDVPEAVAYRALGNHVSFDETSIVRIDHLYRPPHSTLLMDAEEASSLRTKTATPSSRRSEISVRDRSNPSLYALTVKSPAQGQSPVQNKSLRYKLSRPAFARLFKRNRSEVLEDVDQTDSRSMSPSCTSILTRRRT